MPKPPLAFLSLLTAIAVVPACAQLGSRDIAHTPRVLQAPKSGDGTKTEVVETERPEGQRQSDRSSADAVRAPAAARYNSGHADSEKEFLSPASYDQVEPAMPLTVVTLESSANQRDDSQARGRPLTLSELQQIALDNNPPIQQTLAVVERARGIQIQVGLIPNPVAGYQASEIGNEGQSGQQGVFVGQEFVTANKLGLNRRIAGEDLQLASWQWQAQAQRVLNSVGLQYYELLGARRTLELAKELRQIADSALTASKQLLEAGEGNKSQVLQASIELRRSWITVHDAENRERAIRRRLAALLGDASLLIGDIEGSLERDPPTLAWEESWQRLVEESPEMQIAYVAVNRARWAIERARVEPIPNLIAEAALLYDDATTDTVVGLELGAALPIFNRNQGNIRAARAELIQASYEAQRVRLALQDRLAKAFQEYENARQQVKEFKKRILPLARESFELTSEGYKQGQQSFLQLLTVQRTYFQANLAYVSAQTSFWKSIVAIQGLLLTDGLSQPGSADDFVPRSDVQTTTPLGLFPTVQP